VTIKAIETRYAGCRFRSRLEARWAVFFDAAGIKWEYETEGYEIDGIGYLPDFKTGGQSVDLHLHGTFVEVKGSEALLDKGFLFRAAINLQRSILILGPIPRILNDSDLPAHTLIDQTGKVQHFGWGDLGWFIESSFTSSDWLETGRVYRNELCGHIKQAYIKARSARFEHGEKG